MIQCIQDSGICMAMVGKLAALPETQLTRRLKKEGRLFENGYTIRDTDTQLDQMTSGLNFITSRRRLDVLKDYIKVIKYIYDPERYYERVTHTSLSLNPANKYRPGILRMLKSIKALLKVCLKAGFNRTTGWFYWKTLITVIFKNPKAIEAAVNLSAMFIHFHKQSKFIVNLTNNEISSIESCGEQKYNQLMFQKDRNSTTHKKSFQTVVN